LDKKYKNLKKTIFEFVGVILTVILINKFIIFTAYIPSESMVPTLNVGDRVAVTRVYNPSNLKRGDVIIFKSNELNEILVKRLIGLPGDEIEFKGTNIYVNGKKLNEDYINNTVSFEGRYKVPDDNYFFLGDNRSNSFDSRYWKDPFINGKDILGKVQFRIWPLKNIGSIKK